MRISTPTSGRPATLFEKQIRIAAGSAPLANLLHAGAILFVGVSVLSWWSPPMRWGWTGTGVVLCLLTLQWRGRRLSLRAIYVQMLVATAIFGVLWATVFAATLSGADRNDQLLLSCVVVGVLGAGSIALSAHHSLGLSWLAAIALPVAVVLARQDGPLSFGILTLLILYTLASGLGVVRLSATFRARCRGEVLAAQRRADLQVRLDDFEAGTRDWLWETGPDGRFVRVSARFRELSARSERLLRASTLPELLRGVRVPDEQAAADVVSRLESALRDEEAFTGVVVPVLIAGEPRWWSLSGRRHGSDRWRGLGSDVTASVLARQHIVRLATTDPVTGLPNRHDFGRELAERLSRVGPGRPLHLGILDLDDFKAVNDTLGHPLGDLLITEIAQTLSTELREGEFCARFGGDEFVVLTVDLTADEADARFTELLRVIRNRPFRVSEHVLAITGSFGYCECDDPTTDPTTLISSADLALYAAKNGGRDQVRSWTATMSGIAAERATLTQELRRAVAVDEFELHWQPQVDLDTGTIVGWEALVRWNHPRLGTLPPGRFLPLAVETGYVVGIGRSVVSQAVAALSRFPPPMTLSINVSSRELLSPDFVAHLLGQVAAEDTDPLRLMVEVTEDVITSREASAIVRTLRDAGLRISMDDFGTGYSSFTSLAALRFDEIKIDRSFVRKLVADPVHRSLVRTILSMADSLGSTVVAEGVETVEERELLRSMGCHRIQGFLEARPVPLGEVDGLLRARVPHSPRW